MISIPKDEYTQLLPIISKQLPPPVTIAQLGTASNCLLSSTFDLWVIDFGVTKHMTGISLIYLIITLLHHLRVLL